jgi:hypothetical protein
MKIATPTPHASLSKSVVKTGIDIGPVFAEQSLLPFGEAFQATIAIKTKGPTADNREIRFVRRADQGIRPHHDQVSSA